MNKLKLIIRRTAYEDLEAIWEYTVKTWSPNQADKYYHQIIHAFELLSINPQIGKSADHVRKGYRYFKINMHLIYFTTTETTINIIRILHAQIDIPNRLGD